MCTTVSVRRGGVRLSFAVAMVLLLGGATLDAYAGDIILFTASTDYTLNNPSGGYSFPNDPTNQNPNLPAISNGVTLSPTLGGLSNTLVGPLPDGTTYGPAGFIPNAGGTTGWVTTSYTFGASGTFQIIWEVAEVYARKAAMRWRLTTSDSTATRLCNSSRGACCRPATSAPAALGQQRVCPGYRRREATLDSRGWTSSLAAALGSHPSSTRRAMCIRHPSFFRRRSLSTRWTRSALTSPS